MRIDPILYAPPGLDVKKERSIFLGGLTAAVLLSTRFLFRFHRAYDALFYRSVNALGEPILLLREDAMMVPFSVLTDRVFLGFLVVVLGLLLAVVLHYAWFYMGSRSIYLMGRLPSPWLLHRECWTLPLAGLGAALAVRLVLTGLYWLLYIRVTPVGCLPPV